MKEYVFNYGENNEYLRVVIKNSYKEDWYDELDTKFIVEYDDDGEEYDVPYKYSEDRQGNATLYIDSYDYQSKGAVISHILQVLVFLSIRDKLKTSTLTGNSNLNESLKKTNQNIFQAIREIVDEF